VYTLKGTAIHWVSVYVKTAGRPGKSDGGLHDHPGDSGGATGANDDFETDGAGGNAAVAKSATDHAAGQGGNFGTENTSTGLFDALLSVTLSDYVNDAKTDTASKPTIGGEVDTIGALVQPSQRAAREERQQPGPKRRRRGVGCTASHQSDGGDPDPAPREEDPGETNTESAIMVGVAPYTVDPRVRPCQRAALEAYALNHAEPRGKIMMACGTGKTAMGDSAILVEQITALAAILLCKSLSNDNQCQSMTV
jgi:hypothetical protein